MTDQQLLYDYAQHDSEPAFAELVGRHVDLVYCQWIEHPPSN